MVLKKMDTRFKAKLNIFYLLIYCLVILPNTIHHIFLLKVDPISHIGKPNTVWTVKLQNIFLKIRYIITKEKTERASIKP